MDIHDVHSLSSTDPELNTCPESMTGGVQSHLSTTNSQQRLRPTAAYLPSAKRSSTVLANESLQARNLPFTSFLRQTLFPAPTLPLSTSNRRSQTRPWSAVCLRWAVLTYCFLSVVVFSVKIYNTSHRHHSVKLKRLKENREINTIESIMMARSNTSLFDNLSMKQRLSRIFSQWPPPDAFDAFLVRSDYPPDAMVVTACIWTTDLDELDLLFPWAVSWRGPISLLMTTTAAFGSPAHKALLRDLRSQKEHLSLSGISVHLLQVDNDGGSPNSYLNIARLFATTPLVMLVPANLSTPPSISYEMLDSRKLLPEHFPLIVSSVDQVWSSYSGLPVLSPLIIRRNHPVWCTDRFFINSARAADWKECLWQFWVGSFGTFGNMRATIKTSETVVSHLDVVDPIRNRFSVRFRAETCDFAARTMATLGVKNYRDGKKKLAWLKQTCGQQSVEKIFKITER